MRTEFGTPIPCVDKIMIAEKGKRFHGEKYVNPDEEYFQDHFNEFPVLPGALMLEGLTQLSAWHVRYIEDFQNSQVNLVKCKQAKFVSFVKPNSKIELQSEMTGNHAPLYEFKAKVIQDGKTVASAIFTLKSSSLRQESPNHAKLEEPINQRCMKIFDRLTNQKAACI